MEITLSEFLQQDISLRSGEKIRPTQVRIDSQNGKILAFQSGGKFLRTQNIFQKDGKWVSAQPPKKKCEGDNWLQWKVCNRKGARRGKITEIWLETTTFSVTKIACEQKRFWFFQQKKIYGVDDIFEVLPNKKTVIIEEESRVFRATLALPKFQAMPNVSISNCERG